MGYKLNSGANLKSRLTAIVITVILFPLTTVHIVCVGFQSFMSKLELMQVCQFEIFQVWSLPV